MPYRHHERNSGLSWSEQSHREREEPRSGGRRPSARSDTARYVQELDDEDYDWPDEPYHDSH